MANSRYEYHKKYEQRSEPYLEDDFYAIVQLKGYERQHYYANLFSTSHKRVLDLMVDSAIDVLKTFKGDIQLAYTIQGEVNFLIPPKSKLYSRRIFKIISMLTSVFVSHFNSNWNNFFVDSNSDLSIEREKNALFTAQVKEKLNLRSTIGYLKSRQSAQVEHGSLVIDTQNNFDGKNSEPNSIKVFNVDFSEDDAFWYKHEYLFDNLKYINISNAIAPPGVLQQYDDNKDYLGNYLIIRIDGDKFHKFATMHEFHKPNDKRALDLMVESARNVMLFFQGQISLAYGQSDEFSFMVRSCSDLTRDIVRTTSLVTSLFTNNYRIFWDRYFGNVEEGDVKKLIYPAWFDGRSREYPDYRSVINYFKWRQVDCHINNLYNTTLHALCGNYVRHQFVTCESHHDVRKLFKTPITSWINETFLSVQEATKRLTGTLSADKHEILFKQFNINYNDELEQFKKGTTLIYNSNKLIDEVACNSVVDIHHVDMTKQDDFWKENDYIFGDDITQ